MCFPPHPTPPDRMCLVCGTCNAFAAGNKCMLPFYIVNPRQNMTVGLCAFALERALNYLSILLFEIYLVDATTG